MSYQNPFDPSFDASQQANPYAGNNAGYGPGYNAQPQNTGVPVYSNGVLQPAPAPNLYQQQVAGYQQPYYGQKSRAIVALLAFVLGPFGAHHFYLGKSTLGFIQLATMIISVVTAILIVGFFLMLILYAWVFIEFIMGILGVGYMGYDSNGIPTRW